MSAPARATVASHPLSLERLCLKAVLVLGLAGSIFSGTLAYRELAGAGASCPAMGSTIAGVPVCVYGFFMFVFVTAIATWGLVGGSIAGSRRTAPHTP